MTTALAEVPSVSDPAENNMNFLTEWTPESLELAMENEKELRGKVVAYTKAALREGHHFYNLPGQESRKPALSKEGALNLASLFKVVPSFDTPDETYFDDGHYSVRFRCHILRADGTIVATGDGLCTTRESKYAYRWMFENQVPANVDKSALQFKSGQKNGREWKRYQVPNPELPDVYNTVLKMSSKRALVDAVLKLPLVSELFTQDLEDQISEASRQREKEAKSRSKPKAEKPKNEPEKSDAELEAELQDLREAAQNLLVELSNGDEDEAAELLNGRDINQMTSDALKNFIETLRSM